MYDTRVAQSALMTLMGHSAAVTTVQMDDWKVVSGDEAGFVGVWDQRMASKLWEMNNRCGTCIKANPFLLFFFLSSQLTFIKTNVFLSLSVSKSFCNKDQIRS